jgi:hypothetical protein
LGNRDAEAERRNIGHHEVLDSHVVRTQRGLDGGTDRPGFVGRQLPIGQTIEQPRDGIDEVRHPARPADHQNFVELLRRKVGIA